MSLRLALGRNTSGSTGLGPEAGIEAGSRSPIRPRPGYPSFFHMGSPRMLLEVGRASP
jgi:hypothetical protein